jgi:hypothetical protein
MTSNVLLARRATFWGKVLFAQAFQTIYRHRTKEITFPFLLLKATRKRSRLQAVAGEQKKVFFTRKKDAFKSSCHICVTKLFTTSTTVPNRAWILVHAHIHDYLFVPLSESPSPIFYIIRPQAQKARALLKPWELRPDPVQMTPTHVQCITNYK